jgi:hypothetical protein
MHGAPLALSMLIQAVTISWTAFLFHISVKTRDRRLRYRKPDLMLQLSVSVATRRQQPSDFAPSRRAASGDAEHAAGNGLLVYGRLVLIFEHFRSLCVRRSLCVYYRSGDAAYGYPT